MKNFIFSSLLLSFALLAQVGTLGTPSGPGRTVVSPSITQNTQELNPSPNPAPILNQDGSLPNNQTIGSAIPRPTTDVKLRQSMEDSRSDIPTWPMTYPPVSNPALLDVVE